MPPKSKTKKPAASPRPAVTKRARESDPTTLGGDDVYELKRRGKGNKGNERGLLVASPHINKFFLPVLDRKTHEVRNFNCQAISKGSQVFLLEPGIKDAKGRSLFQIRAKVEFRGNTFVRHEDFHKHVRQHHCSDEEYATVRKNWSADKGGCVLWEFIVVDMIQKPTYVVPKQGEEGVDQNN